MNQTVRPVAVVDELGHWSRVLRRRLARVVDVKTHHDLTSAMSDQPTIYVLVVNRHQGTEAIEQTLELCSRRNPPYVLAIVPPHHHLGFRMRCAGATAVWQHDRWPVNQISRLIRRICRQAPAPTLSLEERIWKNLPWSR